MSTRKTASVCSGTVGSCGLLVVGGYSVLVVATSEITEPKSLYTTQRYCRVVPAATLYQPLVTASSSSDRSSKVLPLSLLLCHR